MKFGVRAATCILFVSMFLGSIAHASPICDAVLRPNEEKFASDYAVTQAYMFQNAAYEYDRLSKLDANSRAADGSYDLFSAEYKDSNSREEFQEKVRQRLSKESFNMSASEARALSRVFVSDKQVEGWVKCVEASGGGDVLIVANNPNETSFPIKITFMPQTGVGEAQMTINLDGGYVKVEENRRSVNKTTLTDTYKGKSSKRYIVKPSPNSKQVVITTNISGLSDDLTIDLTPRVIVQSPPPAPNPCTSAVQVVTALYKQLLERDPEPEGLSHYVSKLTSRQSDVRQFVDAFLHSPEYKAKFVNGKSNPDIIFGLYKRVLARPDDPRVNDPDGFHHQVGHLPQLGYDQIASNFVNSGEYERKFGNWFAPGNPATRKYCN
jgi:hypothetical protein